VISVHSTRAQMLEKKKNNNIKLIALLVVHLCFVFLLLFRDTLNHIFMESNFFTIHLDHL